MDDLFDEGGVLLDQNALDARRAQRDADAWPALEAVLFHGPAALRQARTDLALPPAAAGRLSHGLWKLAGAIAEGTHVRDTWEHDLTGLAHLADADRDPARQHRFAAGLRLRHAAGWPPAIGFSDYYPALAAIERVTQARALGATPRTAAANSRSPAAPSAGPDREHRSPPAPRTLPAPPPAPGTAPAPPEQPSPRRR
ncbi:hypothetical protein [Actinacidiphila sp. bgisy144]|uniref:hypothetical protein n=1 Tax=Actinacidiphila sp. bgisy144 TaxID=3413791 RepID=UPI003EBA050F